MTSSSRSAGSRPDGSGWHLRASLAVLVLLAFLQGLAPLLHAHVTGQAGAAPGGIHMPVAVGHEDATGAAVVMTCAGTDEGGVVTVPPELRRDRPLVPDQPFLAVVLPELAAPVAVLTDHPHAVVAIRGGTSPVHLPPAQGPPLPA